MTDESWAGWYRDRDGSEAVVLTTDGQQLRIRIRGVDFEGESFDRLVPVAGTAPESGAPAPADGASSPAEGTFSPADGAFSLADGALTDCVLEWDLPLPVRVDGTLRQATLGCLLSLRRVDPDLHLALHLDGAVYESARAESDFAAALTAIQRILPDGVRLQTCIACAFSAPFPLQVPAQLPAPASSASVPGPRRGLSGSLACFGEAKGAPGDRRTGLVQEVWSCREFEGSPSWATDTGTDTDTGADTHTGHRGAFPLESV
ncbi:DUF6304 family protein [Streptomyces sp. DvalAA-19]|uniref:DUF6304 family protein n=1 Tax=Streptomyces sp. DvalAA-19 TaxID=1839761 RepID=UPI00081AF703|nr:DUF6304 family protein [Streptomyces sp. DvalAA-19]SCD79115.1 hypothetical protein GA0115244_11097 [Streptomyces sp. DvalAA-19]